MRHQGSAPGPATVSVYSAEVIERLLVTDIKDLVRYEPRVNVI